MRQAAQLERIARPGRLQDARRDVAPELEEAMIARYAAAAGISEGLLRVAVGLEAGVDLQNDLDAGLALI